MKDMLEREENRDVKGIQELSCLFGPSGNENEVAEYIKKRIEGLCDDCLIDKMGNLLALVRTGDKNAEDRIRIMLSAHTDEVGIMVTEICDNGLLHFDTVGGIDVSVLEGRRLTLVGKSGKINGLVMSKAVHHVKRSDRSKANKIEKLYIDIGAKNKEDAEKYISVGDLGVFDSEFYLFGEGDQYMKGKALDDRMGCEALIEVMEKVWAKRLGGDLDLYFCFTVREEIGLSGARVAANKIAPHIAIVLESTAIADLPSVDKSKRVADVGKGGALSVADRATIYDRELIKFALDVGRECSIPVQTKRYVSGGNDAGSIHRSREGVRCLALSVPTRYLHSPSCVAKISDFCAVRDLVEAMLQRISKDRP